MIVAIDFGGTTTDVVCMKSNKLVSADYVDSKKDYSIEQLLRKFKINNYKELRITGGMSHKFKKYRHIDEIKAIGLGGSVLADKKRCLVVSMGTGTCIVNVDKKISHIGGTGVGGGTVIGLSKLLANIEDINKIKKIAKSGKISAVDLSVKDIVGKGIGIIPGNATASNFGKAASRKKEDKIMAAVNMVGETIAMLSIFASDIAKQKDIVLTGKLAQIKPVVDAMKKVGRMYGKSFIVPKNAGFATAIGAAMA